MQALVSKVTEAAHLPSVLPMLVDANCTRVMRLLIASLIRSWFVCPFGARSSRSAGGLGLFRLSAASIFGSSSSSACRATSAMLSRLIRSETSEHLQTVPTCASATRSSDVRTVRQAPTARLATHGERSDIGTILVSVASFGGEAADWPSYRDVEVVSNCRQSRLPLPGAAITYHWCAKERPA